jgi:GTP-binding protein HflX
MPKVFGNLSGLKPSERKRLERIVARRSDRQRVVSVDLARELGEAAWEIGRNVGVLLDRSAHVQRVLIGDMHGVPLPDLGAAPAPGRLCGLRLVRSELRGERELSSEDAQQLVRHRLDAHVRLLLDEVGEVLWVAQATIDPARSGAVERGEQGGDEYSIVGELVLRRLTALPAEYPEELAALEEELGRSVLGLRDAEPGERALLVGIHSGDQLEAQSRMHELVELARSALLAVADTSLQNRERPDPRTLLGKGKVRQLAQDAVRHGATVLVVDRELSGVQQRNLAEETGLEVIDRTDLVLRIFERRAQTRASRIRVQLARLSYELPRLTGREHGLSRIGRTGAAGVGTRGKGERRVDMDRRRMRERIHRLEKLLQRVGRQAETRSRRRKRNGIPVVALVGYTNAGKTSWLNALTEAHGLSEDLLFATLDTAVRRTRLPMGTDTLFVDTVGFLREMPEGLGDAFRSTLREVESSDLLLQLVDAHDRDWKQKEETVLTTLEEIGLAEIPRITVYNKKDLVDLELWEPLARKRESALVSVRSREDRYALREIVEDVLLRVRDASLELGEEPDMSEEH